mgnify:CR=1 FL=1
MSECNYSGCGHEGKIDGLCAKHHELRDKAIGKVNQADEPSCSKCGRKASEVKVFLKRKGLCKHCAYYDKVKAKKEATIKIKRQKPAAPPKDKPQQSDTINHPPHYTTGKIEVIDFIADQELGYLDGNIIKYVARYRHKGNPVEDLKKAQWYLERLIKQVAGGGNE